MKSMPELKIVSSSQRKIHGQLKCHQVVGATSSCGFSRTLHFRHVQLGPIILTIKRDLKGSTWATMPILRSKATSLNYCPDSQTDIGLQHTDCSTVVGLHHGLCVAILYRPLWPIVVVCRFYRAIRPKVVGKDDTCIRWYTAKFSLLHDQFGDSRIDRPLTSNIIINQLRKGKNKADTI